MNKIFKSMDIVVRGIAFVSLFPLGLMVLVLGVMATSAPNSGILPLLLILGVAGLLALLIACSCLSPELLARRFGRFEKLGYVIGRAPAYLFAPFGLYYGSRFLMNFHPF